MKAIALLLCLAACNDYPTTIKTPLGIYVVNNDKVKDPYYGNYRQCIFYDSMLQETDMAFESVLYAIYTLQLDDNVYEFNGLDESRLTVCFTPHAIDGLGGIVAGLTYEGYLAFVALGRNKDQHDIKQTALAHELLHAIIARMCILDECSNDPGHLETGYWYQALPLANYIFGASDGYDSNN